MSKITVLGSFVVDLLARTASLPQPGQTLVADDFSVGAGGKGHNQAIQSHLMGCETTFICKTGDDDLSRIGLNLWDTLGFHPTRLIDPHGKTGCANILVDAEGQNQIAVFLGANATFSEQEIRIALQHLHTSAFLLLQSEINPDAIELAVEISLKAQVPVVYNPAPYRPLSSAFLKKLFLITPNETEAAALLGWETVTVDNAKEAAISICRQGPQHTLITLGAQGCCVADSKNAVLYPTFKVNVIDTVGAGDSFNGALVAMMAQGLVLTDAVRYALAASALSVQSSGSAASMKPFADVSAFLQAHTFSF